MKNSLERFKGRSEQAEGRISELEDKTMEIIKAEEQKEKRLKKSVTRHHQEDQHTHCWNPSKRRERERGRENI